MSPEARPEAVRFDPGSAEIPSALGPALNDPDTPILLLVAPDTGDAAARVAIGLAEARARSAAPTILADGAVADPRLHEVLDTENLEGVADVFLFGASLQHVRVRPDTRHFDFVPTGAYVPDPAAVLTSERWDRIGDELRQEGAMLLLFVPVGTPGLPALSQRVGRALLIGDERGVERVASRLDPACTIVGVVEPTAALAPERLSADAGTPAPGAATIFDEPKLTEPPVFRGPQKRNRVSPFLLVLLVIVLAVAAWFLYREYLASPAPVPSPVPAPARADHPTAARPEPVAVETPIPVSVQVEAHQDLRTAEQRAAQLGRAEPGIAFYLAPLSVKGDLYYRLLAGPVADRDAGLALMQRLYDSRSKTSIDDWAVLPTRLAFRLGDYTTPEAARARVDSLAATQIPAYVIPIRYRGGPPHYRVYGGAYTSVAEAEVMKQMLKNAGVDAPLVERTGEPAAGGA